MKFYLLRHILPSESDIPVIMVSGGNFKESAYRYILTVCEVGELSSIRVQKSKCLKLHVCDVFHQCVLHIVPYCSSACASVHCLEISQIHVLNSEL
jgi:hypothetical protein